MEPACLASSKQAANSPAEPQGGATSKGVLRPPVGVPQQPRTVLGRQTITFGTRKARVSAAEVLRAPEWSCPGRAPGGAPSGPKMAQNHQKRAPVPPWADPEDSVVQVDGQNQLGYCLGCLLAVFGPVWPRNGVRWAQNRFIWAPDVSCGLNPTNGRISG